MDAGRIYRKPKAAHQLKGIGASQIASDISCIPMVFTVVLGYFSVTSANFIHSFTDEYDT